MKYVLGMTTYNRPEYLKVALKTLSESDLTLASKIFIFDDGSSDNVINIIKQFKEHVNVPVRVFRNKKCLGANLNIAQACSYIFENEDLAVMIDSDSKFGKQWLNKIDEAISNCDSDGIQWGFISVFNAPNHKTLGTINKLLIRKKDLGSFGSVMKRDIFKKMLNNEKFPRKHVSFDWKYGWQCDLENKLILCTKKSYIQHIGFDGTNSNKNSVDIGIDFVEL